MNRDAVRVRHQNQEVWSAPYLDDPSADIRAPYHLVDLGRAAGPK